MYRSISRERLVHQEMSRLKNFSRAKSKLSPDIVREIRSSSSTQKELAEKYAVSVGNIQSIQKFYTWKDVF